MACSFFKFLNQDPLLFDIVNPDFNVVDIDYPSLTDCNFKEFEFDLALNRIVRFSAILLFIGVLLYHKYQYKTFFFKNWVDDSIFTLLDVYYHAKKSKLDHSISVSQEFSNCALHKNVYIFDFETYCCLCCHPYWIHHVYYPLKKFLKEKSLKIKMFFLKNSKTISYYSITFGFMLFKSIEDVLSLLLANNCLIKNQTLITIFVLLDLFLTFWYTFNIYFLMSFLTIRREIQRIDQKNQLERAYILYFTLAKGFFFGLLVFLIKVVLIFNTGKFFYEIGRSPALALYSLGRQLIFLSLLGKCVGKNMAIKNDCEVLKEESKIFLMQNFIYKKSIGITNVVKILENEYNEDPKNFKYDGERLSKKLEEVCNDKIEELEKIFQINDSQIFKNVLIKSSKTSKYPKRIAFLIFLDCFLYVIIDIMILASFKMSRDEDAKDLKCNYHIFINIVITIVAAMECFLMPYYIFYTVKRRTFFGNEENSE